MKLNFILLVLVLFVGFPGESKGSSTFGRCTFTTSPELSPFPFQTIGPWFELGKVTFTATMNCTDPNIQGATFDSYQMNFGIDDPNIGFEGGEWISGQSVSFAPNKVPGIITLDYKVIERAPSCPAPSHICHNLGGVGAIFQGAIYGAVLDVSATGTVGNNIAATAGASWGDGNLSGYQWSFSSKPTGSTVSVSAFTSANANFTPDKSGSYVLRVSMQDQGGHSFFKEQNITVTGTDPNPTPTPDPGAFDLSIGNLEIYQAVRNFKLTEGDRDFKNEIDFDLVKGKGAAIFTTLSATKVPTSFREAPVVVKATLAPLSGGEAIVVNGVLPNKNSIQLKDIESTQQVEFRIAPELLAHVGQFRLEVKVETIPGLVDASPNNDRIPNLPVQYVGVYIHEMPKLEIIFTKVMDCEGGGCYSAPDDGRFNNLSIESIKLAKSTFPIPDLTRGFGPDFQGLVPFSVEDPEGEQADFSQLLDIYNMCLRTWQFVGDPEPDTVRRVIGVVSSSGSNPYFKAHGMEGVFGYTSGEKSTFCGAAVRDNAWKSVAHEIGHNLPLLDDDAENGPPQQIKKVYTGDKRILGYNYELDKLIKYNEVPARCVAKLPNNDDLTPPVYQNFMSVGVEEDIGCNWIDTKTYRALWNALIKNKNLGIADSVIVYYEKASKTVKPYKAIRMKANLPEIDPSEKQQFSATGLMVAGGNQKLAGFDLGYSGDATDNFTTFQSSAAITVVPVKPDVYWISFSDNKGQAAGGYSPDVVTLSSAIDSVPAASFLCPKSDAVLEMKQSLNTAAGYIKAKRFLEAESELDNNLLVKIQSCISNDSVSDPLSYNLSKIVGIYSGVKERVGRFHSLLQRPGGDNGLAEVITDKSQYSLGERPFVRVQVKTPAEGNKYELNVEVWNDGKLLPLSKKSNDLWSGYSYPASVNGDEIYADVYQVNKAIQKKLLSRQSQLKRQIAKLAAELKAAVGLPEQNRIKSGILTYSRELISVRALLIENRTQVGSRLGVHLNVIQN